MPNQRILVDGGSDNQSFYEGLGAYASVPWEAWMEPLFWWSILLMSLYVAMISAAVSYAGSGWSESAWPIR